MNLNLAEKLGIFLGATTLSFALGIVACSPLAPSVEKNRLTTKTIHQEPDGSTLTPQPTPNGLHLLFYRSHGANLVVGREGYEWFFKSQPKNVKEVLVSGESLPGTLDEFKRLAGSPDPGGRVEIPVIPSADWQPSADGSFSGSVAFQLNLADNAVSPSQIETFEYELTPPPAAEVRRALEAHRFVNWTLDIKNNVARDTKTVFLNSLDAIRLTINCKEDPVTAAAPAPIPNAASALEEAAGVSEQE